jgi:ubiquinone/menaquinone biosynthesis C-methylase UbiE
VSATFAFGGFAIPHGLALLTGGGEDTWAGIAAAHLAAYARYCPLRPDHDVLEIGCGVGRDAIPLTRVLRGGGSYVGLDVSAPSIAWCQEHITPRHPDFRFAHLDIHSQFYNPGGVLMGDEVTLPVADRSIDRIILQSVFTHMFEQDITHFLRQFHRVLRPGGRVFASFFVLDPESLRLAGATRDVLKFAHERGNGCRINDPDSPEAAVAYTRAALRRMVREAGFRLDQPRCISVRGAAVRGSTTGRTSPS